MKRRRTSPTSLSRVLRKVYPSSPEGFDSARVFGWWAQHMPARIVERARPVKLQRGVLYINVSSSAWAQELHHSAPEILERLRASVPETRIRAVRFQVGQLPELPMTTPRSRKRHLKRVELRQLPEELGRALAHVRDDELRAVIASAAATSLENDD